MTTLFGRDSTAQFVAGRLRRESFTLLDVGCSGGIHPAWRAFGDRLKAIGFDPNVEEVARLRSAERHPGVAYEAAFVGVPDGHPLASLRAGKSYVGRTPWDRLSVARTIALREDSLKRADNRTLTEINAWPRTKLTSDPPVFLPDYIAKRHLDDIDFVKIDIDGADFIVLRSLFESPVHSRILGFMLEVNFHGSDDESEHTLHNTDRLMRRMGFELFDLSVRRYSSSALPHPYEYDMPAQTLGGRPFQGDALYVRDLSAPEMRTYASTLSDEKIAKAIAIFSLSGHHDQAAETMRHFADRLTGVLPADTILDMLAKEVQKNGQTPLGYRDYIAAFERDDAMFYPYRRQSAQTDAAVPLSHQSPAPSGASSHRPRRKPLLKRVKKWLKRWRSGVR
jgi:FkbM family methyltransferase